MTLPSDNQQANDDTKVDDATRPEYEMLGNFKPRDAKRILKQLEEQHLPFEVEDCDQIGLFANWPWRRIYVRRQDKEKAEAISDQDSARSRAVAGICYMAVGGVICAWALLQMRSGVRSIPWHQKFGGVISLPLEMVAGVAGIVVFMGFIQLVVAFIVRMRGRQRSHLVNPLHLTNR
jgi:hypothetical protein